MPKATPTAQAPASAGTSTPERSANRRLSTRRMPSMKAQQKLSGTAAGCDARPIGVLNVQAYVYGRFGWLLGFDGASVFRIPRVYTAISLGARLDISLDVLLRSQSK